MRIGLVLVMLVAVVVGLAAIWDEAEASPEGLAVTAGYSSFWFAPHEEDMDVQRPDNGTLTALYTSAVGAAHYMRVGGTAAGGDAGLFVGQWGWKLSPTTAAFLGGSVRYLDEGSVPGYEGTSFALGLGGSIDLEMAVSDAREKETIRLLFGVETTTRPLTHVATGRKTNGLTIVLGMDLAETLFAAKQ